MRRTTMLLAVVVLLGLGCTPWRGIYLSAATNAATQDKIAQKLGPPHRTRPLEDGNTLWQYQHMGGYEGSGFCREYILTFDQQKVLRNWSRQDCPRSKAGPK